MIPATTRAVGIAKKGITCFEELLLAVPPDKGGRGFTSFGSESFGGSGWSKFGISAEGLSASGCAGRVDIAIGRSCFTAAAFSKTVLILAANRWQSLSKPVSV